MVRHNVGIMLGMSDLTEDLLIGAINKITKDTSYYENVSRMSDIFRNNPIEPLQSAVFWIEYVMKYKGAYHLKSGAVNLEWYQYLMLDVFGAIVSIILLACYLVVAILRFISRKICGKQSNGGKKKKEKIK